MNGSGGLSVGTHQSDGIYSGSSRRQKGRAIAPFLGRLLSGGLQKYKTLLKHYAFKESKQQQRNKHYASERETIGFLCSRLEALYPGDHLMAVWAWIGLGWS